jgi:uncharacterized protein
MSPLTLTQLPDHLAVCRLDARAPLPVWAGALPFCSITRTADELSIICSEDSVPDGVQCDRGWRALKIEGPFAFSQTGIIASIAQPLAAAGIGLLAIATYDTDYVLIQHDAMQVAIAVLQEQGHVVHLGVW